jgi:biotin operon repressor
MTKEAARKKLEKNGYKIISILNGGYIAQKNSRTYIAETINGLLKKVF